MYALLYNYTQEDNSHIVFGISFGIRHLNIYYKLGKEKMISSTMKGSNLNLDIKQWNNTESLWININTI